MRFAGWLSLVLSLAALVCAEAGAAQGRASGDVIPAEEIAGALRPGMNAYELVQNLRPSLLRSRGHISTRPTDTGAGEASMGPGQVLEAQGAVVYLNGARLGGVDALRQVPAETVESIRYLSGTDATTAYGSGHGAGAILLATGRADVGPVRIAAGPAAAEVPPLFPARSPALLGAHFGAATGAVGILLFVLTTCEQDNCIRRGGNQRLVLAGTVGGAALGAVAGAIAGRLRN